MSFFQNYKWRLLRFRFNPFFGITKVLSCWMSLFLSLFVFIFVHFKLEVFILMILISLFCHQSHATLFTGKIIQSFKILPHFHDQFLNIFMSILSILFLYTFFRLFFLFFLNFSLWLTLSYFKNMSKLPCITNLLFFCYLNCWKHLFLRNNLMYRTILKFRDSSSLLGPLILYKLLVLNQAQIVILRINIRIAIKSLWILYVVC